MWGEETASQARRVVRETRSLLPCGTSQVSPPGMNRAVRLAGSGTGAVILCGPQVLPLTQSSDTFHLGSLCAEQELPKRPPLAFSAPLGLESLRKELASDAHMETS